MGRKIVGKKHRGVKDPDKQRAKRLSEIEDKINNPPKNLHDQDIPKSLERLIKLKNAVKNNEIGQKKRKKKKTKLIKLGAEQSVKLPNPKAKPEKIVPIFNQRPDESQDQFWRRVSRETHDFLKESEFERKYNVQVQRNAETGEIEGVVKQPKDELEELQKLKSKHNNINKKKKVLAVERKVKLTKSQKRKQKLLKKQETKNQDNVDEFKAFKDKIEFGEVVHAPPELKVHAKHISKSSKVKSSSLLLSKIFEENKSTNNPNGKLVKKSAKRKDLPVGERRQLEKLQNDAIASYRLLKARKFGESAISA